MSIESLQQELTILQKKHNKFMLWTVLAILILAVGGIIALSNVTKTGNDQQVKALTDTILAHDKVNTIRYQQLQEKQSKDSIRYSGIEQQVSRFPSMLAAIKQRYDNKRTILNSSTDDEQLSILTDWLSQTDSI